MPDDVETACEESYLPQPDWYVYWEQLDLAEERDNGSGLAVVIVLAILMMLAGTTFAGHDWASGSVSNQLLFEPRTAAGLGRQGRGRHRADRPLRRRRGDRLLAGAGAVAGSRDLRVGNGLLLDCLQSGWRGAGVAAAAALAGYALTMLFRSTVAALGILLAASVAGGIVLAVIGVDSVWNPGLNIAAVILDGAKYYAEGPCPGRSGLRRQHVLGREDAAARPRAVVPRHRPGAVHRRFGRVVPPARCALRSRTVARATSPTNESGRQDDLLDHRQSRPGGTVADVSAPVPEGRKLLRLEVRNAETPIERKPSWIKTRAKMGPEYTALQSLVKSEGLHTVCQEAGCPNIFECWEDREATFLIGGDQCTRRCDFCQIDTGKPQPLDRDEPRRVAESVQKMELRYATITGVARDDLDDGGAWLYAETVRAIHELNPGTGVENLIPDFNGIPDLLQQVFESRPGGAGPQRRDGAADLQADPAGVPLRALARRAHPGPHVRPGHQVEPDPRHGRDPRGGQPGDARPPRRRLRAADHHPVPPPVACGTTPSSGG